MTAQEQLIEALTEFGFDASGKGRRVSEETVAEFVEALRPLTSPEFVCLMVGDTGAFTARFEGLEGFAEAWHDWLASFDWLELSADEDVVETEDKILALGSQRAKSATAGIEVENDAAAVWTFRDDRLTQVEFHLDSDTAWRAAGLEPGQRP